ncbi:MAG: hypothetical protein COA54_02535 [Thiotrichaceae bacterium]|nr:MAG: hypothetical protein COA54_02535 [Thiotrichaceae bacterium]
MYGKPLFLFDNMLATSPVTTDNGTAAGDYVLASLFDYRSYTWWLTNGAGNHRVTVTNDADRSADYMYIAGDILTGSTITLTSSDLGGANAVVHINNQVLDGQLAYFFEFASYSQRVWFLDVVTANPSALSHLIIGNKLELPRHLQQGFDPLGSKPRGRIIKSSNGHPLGTAEDWREWKQKISFRNINASWVRDTWKPAFDDHLKHTPGVFVWDPVEHANETYLIHPIFEYRAPHVQGQFTNLSFTLEGLGK